MRAHFGKKVPAAIVFERSKKGAPRKKRGEKDVSFFNEKRSERFSSHFVFFGQHLSLLFSVSSKEAGGQKIKLIVLFCLSRSKLSLSLSHSFLKEPPSRRTIAFRVADKDRAFVPNASSPLWNKRESAFFTPHIRTTPNMWEARDKQNLSHSSPVSFSLCLLLSAPPPQPLSISSSSRDIAKEQIWKKSARARASINVPSRPRRRQ